jgi:hypothetical protein
LIDIPVLYDLLQYEESMYCRYSPSILAMCRWMYTGGSAVLKALIVHDLPPKDFHEEPISWTKVAFILISLMNPPETTGRADVLMVCRKSDIVPNTPDCGTMSGVKLEENVAPNAPSSIPSMASSDSLGGSCARGALIAYAMAFIASPAAKVETMFSQL